VPIEDLVQKTSGVLRAMVSLRPHQFLVGTQKVLLCLLGACVASTSPQFVRMAYSQPLKTIGVSTAKQLRTALQNVLPGTKIAVAPGLYKRGIFLKNVHGNPEAPIIITRADPEISPIFQGRGEGAKLSGCSYIKLKGLVFKGCPTNGINIDDGGKRNLPSHHIVVEDVTIVETGRRGNQDALKMSGVDHFVIRNCRFQGWGGSAIDLVGCHNGIIENCLMVGKEGFRTANGIQIKGGSESVLVQNCVFRNAGWRTVSIGGSTGLQYFRPAPKGYEARGVIVAGNVFVGSEAQIAWVTAVHSYVHHNLFYLPEKWVGRILQETRDPSFTLCGVGLFEHNVVVTDNHVKVFFNVGERTAPESFVFRSNVWYRLGGSVDMHLPTPEENGIYDVDPAIKLDKRDRLRVTSDDPRLRGIGPNGYKPWKLMAEFSDVTVPSFTVPRPPQQKDSAIGMNGYLLGGLLALALLVFCFRRIHSRRS